MPVTTPSFVYPTNMELMAIDQDLIPVLTQSNPIFNEFPIVGRDATTLKWEQRANYLGLMQARGPEGSYPVVPAVSMFDYELTPGRYGEHSLIQGKEIEDRRGFGTVNTPINVTDIVAERHEQLATRNFNLMAQILWSLLTSGYYTQVGINGAIIKKDAVILQGFDSVASGPGAAYWSNQSGSTPIGDFRAVKLLHRGHSTMFDGKATAWANMKTVNYMLSNTNTSDLFGRRSQGLETIEGIDQYNSFIALRDNLPKLVEFDGGYNDDNNVFQPHIPDGIVVLIGKRTNGAALGEFSLTRNVDNGNSSSTLVKVVEHGLRENDAPPANIGVYRGFNGGPRVFYGTSIVIMKVA